MALWYCSWSSTSHKIQGRVSCVQQGYREWHHGSNKESGKWEFKGREIVDLVKDESNNFKTLFSKLTNTKAYTYSNIFVR